MRSEASSSACGQVAIMRSKLGVARSRMALSRVRPMAPAVEDAEDQRDAGGLQPLRRLPQGRGWARSTELNLLGQ